MTILTPEGYTLFLKRPIGTLTDHLVHDVTGCTTRTKTLRARLVRCEIRTLSLLAAARARINTYDYYYYYYHYSILLIAYTCIRANGLILVGFYVRKKNTLTRCRLSSGFDRVWKNMLVLNGPHGTDGRTL